MSNIKNLIINHYDENFYNEVNNDVFTLKEDALSGADAVRLLVETEKIVRNQRPSKEALKLLLNEMAVPNYFII